MNPASLCLDEDPQTVDEMNLRQPPPYPGHVKAWQQPGYSQSSSGSEAGMETSLSSMENISCCARQEPQGEETSSLLQSFGDGNPPPGGGGGGDAWQSNLDLSNIKGSSNSLEMREFDAASAACMSETTANSYAESSKSVGQHDSPLVPSHNNSIIVTGSPLSTSNSLISQLLQSSSEHAHLRSLLQNRLVRSCAMEPSSSSETRTQPKHNVYEESIGSRRSPVAPTTLEAERATQEQIVQTVVVSNGGGEMPSAGYGESGKATGSPKSRSGHPLKTTSGSPKSNNAGDNGKIGHCGSAGALSRCAAPPARDLQQQRPATAPSIHQIGPNLEVRLASTSVFDSTRPAVAKSAPCIGSQPDLTCLVEVTMSNGTVQHVPAKVVTSVKGRELMRLSSYSTAQPPPPYLLPTVKQIQMLPSIGAERQQTKSQNQNSQKKHLAELDHAAIATRATQMVERLSEENQALRQELKSYYKKVSTLEKVERDIQKVSDAYETLVLHSQKRENLEKLMRFKLEAEIRNLNEVNKELKEQLERNLYQLQRKQGYSSTPDSELKREMQRKDALIAKLIVQNRELMNAKERLEMDTSAQRSTMENQLQRIGMLENALTNTQVNANRCDEEIQMERHRTDDQGSSDLQMALSQLQLIAEKQHDAADQRLGTKIDDDFHLLRNQQCDTDDGISSDSESPTSIHSLIRQMQEKERRILQLEAEVSKWEQKFLDETLFRQLAIEPVSKDGRMPGLEPNSLEDGRYWTRSYSDRVLQLRELYEANLRCADSEARLARAIALIRTLQAELAEKEMLIKILQHHASLSRSSSISSLLLPSSSSPLHSPHHRSPTSAAYMMSMSVPASGATSRQSSQVDDDQMYSCTNREQDQRPVHVKSSSANNALGNCYDGGSPMLSMELPTQYQASAQALSYGSSQSLQSGSDHLKHCFWQV